MPEINRPRAYSLLVLALFAQLVFSVHFRIEGLSFNLPILALAFLCLQAGSKSGLEMGIVMGCLIAPFTAKPFAQCVALFGLCGLLIGYLGQRFYKGNVLSYVFTVLLAEAVLGFPTRFANLLFSPFMFYALRRVFMAGHPDLEGR
ncbi:MAG: hypothetical protein ABH825_01555 [Candidatus Omnitrophota bacterium]